MDEEEAPPGRGDAKFSWEVIRDNSIFTYRIDLVPAYAEVMAALQASQQYGKILQAWFMFIESNFSNGANNSVIRKREIKYTVTELGVVAVTVLA